MKNIRIYREDGNIKIEIPSNSIVEKLSDETFFNNVGLTPVKDETEMMKYIVEKLQEKQKYNEVELNPVEKMLIQLLQEACKDLEDFLDYEEEYE